MHDNEQNNGVTTPSYSQFILLKFAIDDSNV